MLGGIFEKNKIKEKIQTYNNKITQENFWKDKISAQKILKEKKFLENIIEDFNASIIEMENLEQLLELALKENDIAVTKDCEKKNKFITLSNKENGSFMFFIRGK